MKQRAYTLAEVLIALGIVGVLAAIMLPMVNKYKPDTTKVLYLNTYDALAGSLVDAANNRGYYVQDNGDFDFEEYPFANLDPYLDSTNDNHRIEGGRNKLCRVLAENFNILENINDIIRNHPINGRIACDDTYHPYNAPADFRPSFTNKNGVEIMVTTDARAPQLHDNRYQTDIIIDINGAGNGEDCTFNDRCRKPDRFTFRVSANGELQPTDEMGIRYLETRTNLKYKKVEDYDNNSQLANDINIALNTARQPLSPFDIPESKTKNNGAQGNNGTQGNDTPDDDTPGTNDDPFGNLIPIGPKIPNIPDAPVDKFTPSGGNPGSGTGSSGGSSTGGGGGGSGAGEMYVDGPGYVGGGMDGIPHPITGGSNKDSNFSYSTAH